MKKWIAMISVLLLVAAVFTACAQNSQQDGTRNSTGEQTTQNKTAEAKNETGDTRSQTEQPKQTETTSAAPETPGTTAASGTQERITEEQAKQIALNHAGLTEEQVTRLYVHFEYDDGRAEYEVEFEQGRMEYDYEIDALTGEIISWDKDT